jgi:hypothetical protein
MSAPQILNAMFDGKCPQCGNLVKRGEPIAYYPHAVKGKRALHAACANMRDDAAEYALQAAEKHIQDAQAAQAAAEYAQRAKEKAEGEQPADAADAGDNAPDDKTVIVFRCIGDTILRAGWDYMPASRFLDQYRFKLSAQHATLAECLGAAADDARLPADAEFVIDNDPDAPVD